MSSENQDLTIAGATKISFFPAQTQVIQERESDQEQTVNFETTKKNINEDPLEVIYLEPKLPPNETQKVVVKNNSGKIEPLQMI